MLGARSALPCSHMASLHAEIIGGRVSLGPGFFLACFLLESRTRLNVSGSWGRSDPHHWCWLWWRGGKPKACTFPCKDTVEQIRIQLQLASYSFILCSSLCSACRRLDCHPGGSALPGMLPCAPESRFINPDLIIKITERENNKSGLLAVPALKPPSPRQASVP